MTTQTQTAVQVRDAWDAIADGFDRHATPQTMTFGEQVVRRLGIGPGTRVLDVASGSGGLSIPAARAGADVVAVDIAPTMIERLDARARTEGLSTLRTVVGDGTALDLDSDGFDVTMSLNGVSLFPDLAGGLREMVRVTRSGGHVAVATFGPLPQIEFIAFFFGALRAVVPDDVPAPDGPPPPFRLADTATFERTLQDAALVEVSVERLTWEMPFDSVDHHLEFLMAGNPIAGQMTSQLSADQRGEIRAVLDRMLRERSGGEAGAVLRADMNLGRGTVATATHERQERT